jgi:hypothetical protein
LTKLYDELIIQLRPIPRRPQLVQGCAAFMNSNDAAHFEAEGVLVPQVHAKH